MNSPRRSETAKNHVVRAVPSVTETTTIGEVERLLESHSDTFETINYIYVLDEVEHLIGVLSIKEVFVQPVTVMVRDVMRTEVVAVSEYLDQEQVAILALKKNIKSVPVHDSAGKFLGVVTSDKILSILYSEGIEDTLRLAGSSTFDSPQHAIVDGSPYLHFKKRLPWLVIGLLGGVGAAFIVRHFEEALSEQLVIAAFIPTVVYMADAVGSQTQTIFVRALAMERFLEMVKYSIREIIVNLALAFVLGIGMVLCVFLWFAPVTIAIVLGISIFATVLLAMVIALLIPYAFHRFGYDPAIASGPLATIIRDVLTLILYFGIVLWLL